MVTKYRTGTGNIIKRIEVARETEKSVFYSHEGTGGILHREAKRTGYNHWFDTWEEAKAHLIDRAERNVAYSEESLIEEKEELEELRNMRNPDDGGER